MHSIYKPLGAKGGEFGTQVHTDTPPETMERCVELLEAFSELKADMMEEVKDIEKKLILPAKIARDALKPMHKVIKKRDDTVNQCSAFVPGRGRCLVFRSDGRV